MDSHPATPALRALWQYADQARRLQGRVLDQLGFAPRTTPSRVVDRWPALRLLAYQPPSAGPPVLLLVPAPIKAAYIWDLAPEISVVRRCLAGGMQVYLLAWHRPQSGDEAWGLAEYADAAIRNCVDAAARETGQSRVFLAGHSLGGTLAAIFASRYSERLRGLIALEAPIAFERTAGSLEAAVARAPPATTVTAPLGNVPGTFLDMASSWADPVTFNVEPWLDWLQSAGSPDAARIHRYVRRWTLDETPLPQRLYEEAVETLYRRNRFAGGTLQVGGRAADPRGLTAPVLAVVNPRSRIVPAAGVDAYRHCTGSKDVQVWEYRGESGVMLQHVGVLVGKTAHARLWPRVLRWMHERAAGAASG